MAALPVNAQTVINCTDSTCATAGGTTGASIIITTPNNLLDDLIGVVNTTDISYQAPSASNAALQINSPAPPGGTSVINNGSINITAGSSSVIGQDIFGIWAAQIASDGNPAGTTNGFQVGNNGAITIALPGVQTNGGAGIWLRDTGGNATAGSSYGGSGGVSGGITVDNSATIQATLSGTSGYAGISATSVGGASMNWGGGGNGGPVSISSSSLVSLDYTWQNAASNAGAVLGILASSQGADGGTTNSGNAQNNGGYGGDGGSSSITLSEYGDVYVTVNGTAPDDGSQQINGAAVATSRGGNGGTAMQGNNNVGGDGGNAGPVSISQTDSYLQTSGDYLPVLVAYGEGGAGGNGGTPAGSSTGNPGQNGGAGGDACVANGSSCTATVSVTADARYTYATTNSSGIGYSPAIAVGQIGGAGGYGGFSQDSGFSTSHGGDGGNGGSGGAIGITTISKNGNVIMLTTDASSSPGIYAYSVGGAGNYGGGALTSIGGSAWGGKGGKGGAGGDIQISLARTTITTNHSDSPGIVARSEGGLGANAGFADAGTGTAYGGDAGYGGASGSITITTDSNSNITTTYGSDAHGILAQTMSAAGGNAGGYNATGGGDGGTAGIGGEVGSITITNGAKISTQGDASRGILAQAMAGTGGSGGSSWSIFHSASSSGGAGGASGAITVANSGAITTQGISSEGILVQSIGGTGGAGGVASGFISNVGGGGGNASGGGALTITNSGAINTSGEGAIGILGQSIGGSGGDGGGAGGITVSVGGTGGSAAVGGGSITANLNSGSSISTTGAQSHGAVFQSIGGGGGNGGNATSTGLITTVAVGGSGGAGGAGGAVTVNANGMNISAGGSKSTGILAQSIGGGGGLGGSAVSGSIGPGADMSVSVGGIGGSASSDGGTVSVTMIGGSIMTGQDPRLITPTTAPCAGVSGATSTCNVLPVDSHGVVVQSIGGGGGKGGQSTADAVALAAQVPTGNQVGFAAALSVGGNGGAGGDGASAQFALSQGGTITTSGNGGIGALVQSIGGGGGDGGDSSAMAATVGYSTDSMPDGGVSNGVSLQVSTGGRGGAPGNGGSVSVTLGGTDEDSPDSNSNAYPTYIQTFGDYAPGIVAQSIGGGGGNAGPGAGSTQEFGMGTSTQLTLDVGRSGSAGGSGGDVNVTVFPGLGVQTWGSGSIGVIAQSIGGGGGTSQGGAFGVSQAFKPTSGSTVNPGVNVKLGNAGGGGGNGGDVTVSVQAPITTHGNDAAGVVAQSIGGGGGVGGGAGSEASGDNPVLSAMQGREFQSDVTNYLKDQSLPQLNVQMSLAVGGTGGAGGDGGSVAVNLSSAISTLGNPITLNGNQMASSGDWSHGILAQSIGGGGGKGGTAMATGAGDPAEINTALNETVGGTGGGGGNGGAVTINVGNTSGASGNGSISTVGYGASGIVAQSIGGGGGFGADGSDTGGGILAVGGGSGGIGGRGGNGGAVTFENSLGGTIATTGTFADGMDLQSIGGGGGIVGAGSSVWIASMTNSAPISLSAGGGFAAAGGGSTVSVNDTSGVSINVSGYGAYGILAQSIGGGGGLILANQTGSDTPTITLGGSNKNASATGGPVTVNLAGDSSVTASGTAGIGVLAQSVGSGGGVIRVNDGINIMPTLTTSGGSVFANGSIPGKGDANSVQVTSYGSVRANGPGGIGIFAQSVGGGGGLVLNGSTYYAGAPLQDTATCLPDACGTSNTNTNNFFVSILGGSVSATSANGVGIFAQAAGFGTIAQQTPTVWVGSGDPSNQVTVMGGTGSGAGVWVDRPAGNNAKVTVQEGGTLTTSVASGGTAVMMSGGGSLLLYNLGTLIGSTITDSADIVPGLAAWDPGPLVASGQLQSDRGAFLNSGTWAPGAVARGNVLNEGVIAFDNAAMTTRMNGHFIQTASGRFSPLIDSLNNTASIFHVDGSATLDGKLVPNAVSLLPGTVPVFSSGNLVTTAQAQDSLVFDWDAKTSGDTITLTPASFTPNIGALNDSQSSLANYYSRGWGNLDRGLATTFAGLSHIDDVGTYKTTLNNLSSKATQAQSMAVIESAGTILGAGMSCPVFVGDGVQLGQDNCVWGEINGRWTDQSSTSDIQGYHVSGTTYRIGAQHQFAPNWFVGGSLAAGQTYARMKGGSSGDGDVYDGSVTVKHMNGPWYFAGSLAMATGSFNNNRQVNVFGDSVSLGSNSSIFLAGSRLRAGYEFDRGDWYVRPYGDVDVVYTHAPGFEEGGSSPYALNVRSTDQTNVSFSPMVEFGRRGNLDPKTTIRAYAAFGMSWRPDNTRTVRSGFTNADSANGTFTDHIKSPEVLAKVDLGLQMFRADGYEVRAGYTAAFGNSFLSQSATARFVYHF